jgi:hypothetical protein
MKTSQRQVVIFGGAGFIGSNVARSYLVEGRRRPDLKRLKSLMKGPVIFDGRNVFDPAQMREEGFTYFGVGRC